jgi:ActD protein
MALHSELYGAVGTFPDEQALMQAIGKVRGAGYSKLEAYTPFPIHGIDDALGEKPSRLGWFVVCCGLSGTTLAATFIWWTSAVSYRLTIGGKPPFDFTFSIPIMFEVTILLSAFASVFGMFGLFNNLPQLYHSIFNYKGSERINDDGFVLAIEAGDPRFDANKCVALLESLGATDVEVVAQ